MITGGKLNRDIEIHHLKLVLDEGTACVLIFPLPFDVGSLVN